LSLDKNSLARFVESFDTEEKVAALSPNPYTDICMTHTSNVSRGGLTGYMWLVETNTAVSESEWFQFGD
jgi:hypothetical protein